MLFSPRPPLKHQKTMSYFFAKVSFLRQQNDGTIKKESEQYLVDAMSFTETEARVIKEVGESVLELTMEAISRSPITEIVTYGDTDLWFKCKVVYKDVDPDSGKEKKTTLYILVNAKDVDEAYSRCKDHLKSMLVPFEIPKVEETAICEIYQYEKPVDPRYKKLDAVIHEIVSEGHTKTSTPAVFVNHAWQTKDNSAEVWAALPEQSKESILFGISDGHYDEDIQGRFLDETFAVDAIRYGMEKKAFKALIDYVEIVVLSRAGNHDGDEGGFAYTEGDEE